MSYVLCRMGGVGTGGSAVYALYMLNMITVL